MAKSTGEADNAPELEKPEENDRQAMPVNLEEPPRLPFPVVGIGASAGGIEAFGEFFKAMPADSGMAFVLIQHLAPDRDSMVAEILSRYTSMPVAQIEDGMSVHPNSVYVIRPGRTLTIQDGKLRLSERVDKPRHSRPVDDFFKSLAEEQRERAIAIIMSGMGSNGSAGCQAIKAVGGMCIAQDPASAQFPSMPQHLIDVGYADFVLRPQDIPEALIGYARHPYATEHGDAEQLLRREQQHVREVLAILRSRTGHDYSGYKKPTVVRRIQRRMGLHRIESLGDYTKYLRQSPTEVIGLADDLLIHVTGFFRDPHAWDILRERVIVPMVAARGIDQPIRCWVTACSSGEEAYSLAILLVEECERVGKPLDVKVFATDTAARTLANARNGIYPGGIEAEMSPERLDRFFQREDAVYRVRQDLRERVVFAPQNVLQDPPFSRLDIVTCRNLLIYLEPQMQQRVMSLLHFGLREGGTLFLGNSESLAGTDDMFEPIDKKARIYRRVGPTRHGSETFPLPTSLSSAQEVRGEPRNGPRPSVAQMTARVLLAHHVPAAVTVDRDFRVLYFHGNTVPYLTHPTGEPTRDLMMLARESVRGAVRTTLQRAFAKNATVTVPDGWIEGVRGRMRVIVTASPLQSKNNQPEFVVVSFQEREEIVVPVKVEGGNANSETLAVAEGELQRVRDELQSTIEELQTSNEEHKASAEEVMSVNEELQSSNEELETSKEEMQSLNEELTTVNSELREKMEELQTTTSDLSSLLSSTDIAVIFLDTTFHIRRFTPAAKSLLELIASDIGRPLWDLAPKFTDPELVRDAQLVLEKLSPIEREITGDGGRWYVRRVLPYRTIDNHIEGIVITFVDITSRRESERGLLKSEDQLAVELRILRALHDVTSRMFTAPDVKSAMEIILLAILDLLKADMGEVQLVDLATKQLKIVVQRGFNIEMLKHREQSSGDDESPAGHAIHLARRCVVEDIRKDASYAEHYSDAVKAGYRAWQSTPLITRKGEVLGVLSTYFREPHSPSEGEMQAIDLFARQAADMIDRIRTEEKMGRLLRIEVDASKTRDQAATMKDEFLATLSHELRTPLSAILLWSKTLRSTSVEPRQMKDALDSIVHSAEAQARLIEDLLDTSRIATGKLRLEMAHTRLGPVVRAAVDAIEPTVRAKGLDLEQDLSGEADGETVIADADRLQQVIWNLLTNAVKFTPPRGKISVAISHKDHQAEIRVSDTGSGIPSEFLPHIFDRFRQFDSSITRKQGGLGLGLAICKQLVDLHGGTIEAHSEGFDKGATFTVRLPLVIAGAAVPRSQRSGGEISGKAPLKGFHVLWVEDEPATRAAVTLILQQAGAKVSEADSAKTALEAFSKSKIDILITDIGLPDMDGYGLLKRIRAFQAKQKAIPIPAVALTAYASDSDQKKAADAGFNLHLAKPIDREKLIAAIAGLVHK